MSSGRLGVIEVCDLVHIRSALLRNEPHAEKDFGSIKEQNTMTTDHSTGTCELTLDELEAVSGGVLGAIAFAVGLAWSMVALGQDTTPTHISNGVMNLLNNPPAGW